MHTRLKRNNNILQDDLRARSVCVGSEGRILLRLFFTILPPSLLKVDTFYVLEINGKVKGDNSDHYQRRAMMAIIPVCLIKTNAVADQFE
jgi:hypothetical protein